MNFLSILNEEITDTIDVKTSHDALAYVTAQNETITEVNVGIRDLDVNIFKKMKHIIKAVNITIFDNFNKLVADAIILKYFSRDVYYEIGCTITVLLFCFFVKKASSSCRVESDSLGLTLVVV